MRANKSTPVHTRSPSTCLSVMPGHDLPQTSGCITGDPLLGYNKNWTSQGALKHLKLNVTHFEDPQSAAIVLGTEGARELGRASPLPSALSQSG